MAGNFWQSSHCAQWILDKSDLLRERHADLQVLTEEEYQKIIIFYANFIQVQFNLLQILKLHMALFTLEMNILTQYDNAHNINTNKFSSIYYI